MKIPAPPLPLVSGHEDDDVILLTDEVSQLDHDEDTILLTNEISLTDHDDDIILLTDEASLPENDDVILLTDEAPLADHDDAILRIEKALPTHHEDEDVIGFSDVAFRQPEILKNAEGKADVIDLSDVIETEDTVADFFELEFSEKPTYAPIVEQPEDSIENLLLELDKPIEPPVIAPDAIGDDISELTDISLESPQTSPDEDLILEQPSSLLLKTPSVSDAEKDMTESLDISIDHPGEVSLSPPIQPGKAESQDKFDDLQNMFNEIIQDSHLPPVAAPAGSSPETGIPENTPNTSEPQFPEIAVTEQQITAVVERVLQNIVSEKIEDMLKSMLTEAVAHEMDTMKSNLLEYLGTARIRNPD